MLLFMHAIVKFCENLCGQSSFFSESFIPMNLFSCLQAVYVFPSCISIVNQLIFPRIKPVSQSSSHLYIFIYFNLFIISDFLWKVQYLVLGLALPVHSLSGGVRRGGYKLLHHRVKFLHMLVWLFPVALPSTSLCHTIGKVIFVLLFILTCRMF